ncbi:MAG TPA: hypothetical protein VFS32_14960, partial [Candidatus Limnocylindrales bacterium]|nr:hypothetical protein [Candidatus Limnocylindrales bacterium]
PDELPEFKPAEKKMAEQLVAAMTGDFDPSQYKDEYREALMQVIEAKIEGRETVAPEEPEAETNLVDLMAALQASVDQAKKARGGEPVSVAEAKAKRDAKKGAKAAEKKETAAAAKKAGKTARGDEAEEEERPARRRKSA